jgi:Lon protease-like protein
MKILDLPKKIPLFPLSNFIIFPKTTVPLNIFEPRYIEMVNNCMKSNKLLGMIQPKSLSNNINKPELHNIGCLGKITSFKETEDNRYLIDLKGLIRFKISKEIKSSFQYREYEVDFKDYHQDLE